MKIPYPVTPEAFTARAKQARVVRDLSDALAGRQRVNDVALAKQINELIGEKVSSGQVGRWINRGTIPDTLIRLWALARVLGVDPGWLAFGTESNAQPPSLLEALPPAPLTPVARKHRAKQR